MKRVYEAGDGLEAHMLAGLLEQSGIVAQVRGDMLQGAVGELPASGLASVWVNEDDEARSLEVIADYEASQPTELDALSGAVVSLGEQFGVPTPVHSFLYSVLLPHKDGVPSED